MTDTKLNLSALKKDSPTSNIENEVTDLVLEPEEIGIPDSIIEIAENQTARDEITLDMGLENFKTDPIIENDFISSPTLDEDMKLDIDNQGEITSSILDNTTRIENTDIVSEEDSPQEKEPVILLEEESIPPVIEEEVSEKIDEGEEDDKKSEKKVILGKKKKTMLSLNSIKSIPKTDAEKKAEVQKALDKKNEDQAARDIKEASEAKNNSNEDITPIENIETGEEQELVPEDKKIVEEATKKIVEDIKAADDTVESDKVQITLDKSLFDNYIPNYKGKKESKAEKKLKKKEKNNESGKKDIKKTKRVRGPINKKKRNVLIVAMFLCILGAGGFVLYPHLNDNSDIKSDVVQVTQDAVREKVDLVLESDNQDEDEDEIISEPINTDENTESEVEDEITETNDIEDDIDEEDTEKANEEKDDKTKVKNYLLDNYYN